MKDIQTWQNAANKLLDYKFTYINNNISCIPLELKKDKLRRWSKDIGVLIEIARKLSHENFQPRKDHNQVVKLYKNNKKLPAIYRPDCIIQNNKLMILELNIDSSLGGLYEIESIQNMIKKNPIFHFKDSNLPSPRKAIKKFFSQYKRYYNIKNVAVLSSKYTEEFNNIKIKEFCKWINEIDNINVVNTTPFNITLNKGSNLMQDSNVEFDLVYRYRSLLHPPNQTNEFIELFESFYNSSSIVLSDPRDLIVEHKGIIALLSELLEKNYLTQQEKDLVKNYIPWTRFAYNEYITFKSKKYKLKELCIKHKNSLVLKKIFSHQGKFVHIGVKLNLKKWTKIVYEIIQNPKDWIVQEYIKSDKASFGFNSKPKKTIVQVNRGFVFSPVFFGKYFGGSLIRILPKSKEDNYIGFAGLHLI